MPLEHDRRFFGDGRYWLQQNVAVVEIGLSMDQAEALGVIRAIQLPQKNEMVEKGDVLCEIDAENGVFYLYSPCAGQVIESNEALLDQPEILLADPWFEGWIVKLESDLMDSDGDEE